MTNTYENKSEEMLEWGLYLFKISFALKNHGRNDYKAHLSSCFVSIISLLIIMSTVSKYQNEQIVLRYVSGCLKNTLAPERL